MRIFMDENFLLGNHVAVKLYHSYAKDMPIFDFHCHLSSKEIAENKSYKNITELWLGGDHYKWRVMRANGIDEELITGSASDYDKFKAWAKTMPYCLGNPLYIWSHMELKRYFNIDKILNEETCDEIWKKTNEMLQQREFTAKELIKRSNVKALCTTDDAIDTLEYHKKIRDDKDFNVKVLPTFRPDKAFNIAKDTFIPWIYKLSDATGMEIKTYKDLIKALENRVEFFHKEGCRLSDHSIEKPFYKKATDEEIEDIFKKAIDGKKLCQIEVDKYRTKTILNLAKMYNSKGWVMQLHIGALRNNNSRMFDKTGPDAGFDSIGDRNVAEPLSSVLDEINSTNGLPKTILYYLNPKDGEVLATMAGNFQGGVPGKIQLGSAWWFNDHKDGMTRQMTILANNGLIRRFVGMVTDSRSFISYTRHEYFRRVLCNLVGIWAESGEVPYDLELLGSMIKEICFENAKEYFGIEV